MEPKIVTREAFSVVGMYYRGANQGGEIPLLWQQFGPRMCEIKGVIGPENAYGICDNMDYDTGHFDYLAALEVASSEAIPEGMVAWTVPGGTWAVFACTLPTLGETYTLAYRIWVPQSEFQLRKGSDFELYDDQFNPDDPASEVFIYVPIKKR